MALGYVVAVVLGLLQGVLEWLPVSSEGLVSIVLSALGAAADEAVGLSLFLHAGTAVAAAAFYRGRIHEALSGARSWRPRTAFADRDRADLTFFVVATLVSGVVGVGAFLAIEDLVGALTGGAFLALVGALLVGTGLLQYRAGVGGGTRDPDREAEARGDGGQARSPGKATPDAVDAVLVGALQGLAVLPGVSRSGTTASALLLRGHDGPRSLELSFLLSVPAALGAGAVVYLETGGVPAIAPGPAAVALAVAAVVGYLTIDGLTRLVGRLPFWQVCVALGGLGVVGGVLAGLL
jgi:undecaprenyl-diphosphatase